MNNKHYNLKIIVLAAGKSERFNGIKLLSKVTQKKDAITLIQYVLAQISIALNVLNIDKSNLYVATGEYHDQIAEFLDQQFTLSYCAQAHCGVGHTIAQSVKKIIINEVNTSHIMILLADQVALSVDDYVHLIKQSLNMPDKLICAKADREIMPPAIFPQYCFTDLMALQGDKGAKALLYKNKAHLEEISLPHAVIDIDTQQDLINWNNKIS